MKSMTGYSKIEKSIKEYATISIEIKALNSKNSNINFKIPQEIHYLEFEFRKIIKKYIKRGTINCYIQVDYSSIYIKSLFRKRFELLKKIFNEFENNDIMKFIVSDFIENNPLIKKLPKKAEKIIILQFEKAIKEMIKFRRTEGKEIRDEFNNYLKRMKIHINTIKKQSYKTVRKKEKKLKNIIKDNDELIKENILIYADKIDISEEISRFNSHLKKIRNENKGSTLNFILQELLREINTIGSKSENIIITDNVIKIKEIIEKMKEQVMNIE